MGSVTEEQVMVTVQCLAYNHEKYIRQTLDGFVMQKTDFRFEVIVHDDASADGTPDIIREYAEKYDFIIPIYQSENQYQNHTSIIKEYIFPLTRGKYYTFCEGDDYWTDEDKLQIMVDHMEQDLGCSSICHSYNLINESDTEIIRTVRTLNCDGIISPDLAIAYTDPPQLASQMFRTKDIMSMPDCFRGYGVGDYPYLLYSITIGHIYYLDRVMTNKRDASKGSWTERVYNDPEKQLVHWDKMKQFLKVFDEYTGGKYSEAVSRRMSFIQFKEHLLKKEYSKAVLHPFFKKVNYKRKAQILVGVVFPSIAVKLEKMYLQRAR